MKKLLALLLLLICSPVFGQPFHTQAAPLAISTQSETNLIYPWKLIFDGTDVFEYENPTGGVATVSIAAASVSDPLKGDTATFADIYATNALVATNWATMKTATISDVVFIDYIQAPSGTLDVSNDNITTTGTVQGVTQAEFNTLTDNSIANALHRHTELVASDGSPDPALSIDEVGRVGMGTSDPEGSLELRTGNSIMRIRDTGATATATTSYIEFGGTTASNFDRTGYVGDVAVGDTHISLRAEDGDLILGDSSSPSVLTLSGGNVTITGTIKAPTATYADIYATSHLVWTNIATGQIATMATMAAGYAKIDGGLDINLPADDNITIDGRTNPREVTVGVIRINHTPEASTLNTRALFLDIDANSVPNTQGLHINLKGTDLQAGETIIGIDIVGDTADSGGGVIRLLELDKTGVGSAEVHGIHVEPEITEVIHHASGTFIDPTQGWDENGGFASTTVAFASVTTNVTIFDANADAIYIGADAAFQEVEIILNTGASNPGIKPTFEIWTGAVWTPITPVDGTAGFRENGIIDMEDVDLSSWVTKDVNGADKFYLQITRTQVNLGTDPIETLIQTAAVQIIFGLGVEI